MSAEEASRLAGLHRDAIRNIRRAAQGGPASRVGVSTRTISALAPVLETTSAWLLDGAAELPTGAPNAGTTLPVIDWRRAAQQADVDTPLGSGRHLTEEFGLWSSGHFAVRVPDDAMNRLAPNGAWVVVDRSDRSLIAGSAYLGVLDGGVVLRRWFANPDRAEPYSTDPTFRTEFLNPGRAWTIIGRVKRAIIDL